MKKTTPSIFTRRLSALFAAAALLGGSDVRAAPHRTPQAAVDKAGHKTAADRHFATFDRIYGDSVAAGMQNGTGLPGDARQNRSPFDVLAALEREAPENIRGANILLTTGTGNDPDQMEEYVPKQLALLKKHGAAHVTVMGLARYREDISGPAYSRRIRDLTKQAGFTYGGMYTADGGDKIHMASAMSYRKLYRRALNQLSRITKRLPLPVFDLAIGGGEALGYRKMSGCSAFVGRKMSLMDLQQKVRAADPSYYKGINVVLTGAAAYGAAFAKAVPEMIDTLKAGGAQVVLAGMPVDRKGAWTVNKRLEKIAREKDIPFTGPMPPKRRYKESLYKAARALAESRLTDADNRPETAAAPVLTAPRL